MNQPAKWVTFAFKEQFSKEDSRLSSQSPSSRSQSPSSQHNSSKKHDENNFLNYLPSPANYYRQNNIYHNTPSDADSDPEHTTHGTSKNVPLPSINPLNLLNKREKMSKLPTVCINPSSPTFVLKNCLEHLQSLQSKLQKNKEYAQKMFQQQQKRIMEAKNKLLDSFVHKQSQIDDDDLKKLIQKRKEKCWNPVANNFKMRKIASETNLKGIEEKKIQKEEKNSVEKQQLKEGRQRSPILAPGYFQKIFSTFKNLKMGGVGRKNQPYLRDDSPGDRGKSKEALRILQRRIPRTNPKFMKK